MSNFIEIYKPGDIVIPFWLSEDPNRYELYGIGLDKSLEMAEKYNINVPQVCTSRKEQIYCPCKPMIILEAKTFRDNRRWAFKVLGANQSIGWVVMVNPNTATSESNLYLNLFGLKKIN